MLLLLLLDAMSLVVGPARAAAPRVDGGIDAGLELDDASSDVVEPDPKVLALERTAENVRDLIGGRLALDITPQTLFDTPLDDERGIELETARLEAITHLRSPHERDAGRRAAASRNRDQDRREDAATAIPRPSVALWEARIDLDRARLEFFSLGSARRAELLQLDASRKADAAAAIDPDRRAHQADAERERALEAARLARTEAERTVSEELARLLGVERDQATYAKRLASDHDDLARRQEATLGWKRRAREARAPDASFETTDSTYDALRKALREARGALGQALETVAKTDSEVVGAGPDPLSDVSAIADTTAVKEQRARVEKEAARLTIEEHAIRRERTSQLLDEIDTLNTERLALLPFLSSTKRGSITGFTSAGVDQALSEIRQLSLIARYHRYATLEWLSALRHGSARGIGTNMSGLALVVFEWALALIAFGALRRRTHLALQGLRKRAQAQDRLDRLTTPSRMTSIVSFVLQVHRPVEWLLLAIALAWLLPASAQHLLEVQLLTIIVEWTLGGALVVVVVDALAGAKQLRSTLTRDTATLRLRSLRLIGRVVVAFALVLALTSRLVGPGTIYRWVWSTCWLASLPVSLVLVRWWREEIFVRADHARKKSPLERWVLANREGWKSFAAAVVGGFYLFLRGVYRAVRSWVGRFDLTRSVLAYLFRRKLGKLEAERSELTTERVEDTIFNALGPETPSTKRLAIDADEELEELRERLRRRRGGVVALVGLRGMGKTTVLRDIHEAFPDTLLLRAPGDGEGALAEALHEAIGAAPGSSLDAAARALEGSEHGRALLLDDAHHLVRPFMGGLAGFDALLDAASKHAMKTTWVVAIDEVVWLFLQRARSGRPLFDSVIRLEPWREEQIAELLRTRTEDANVTPSFERVLEKLPPHADEVDRQDALRERARSYYRLLWDYAAGNPGIALHMWRRSLGADADGTIHVRFFQAPESSTLEQLPDQTIFVLRAIMQLAPATRDQIARATMLQHADIVDALRYAEAHTYILEHDGRYHITWTWLRALTLYLRRRHLLVAT